MDKYKIIFLKNLRGYHPAIIHIHHHAENEVKKKSRNIRNVCSYVYIMKATTSRIAEMIC